MKVDILLLKFDEWNDYSSGGVHKMHESVILGGLLLAGER